MPHNIVDGYCSVCRQSHGDIVTKGLPCIAVYDHGPTPTRDTEVKANRIHCTHNIDPVTGRCRNCNTLGTESVVTLPCPRQPKPYTSPDPAELPNPCLQWNVRESCVYGLYVVEDSHGRAVMWTTSRKAAETAVNAVNKNAHSGQK